jgi:hypothetical protein
MRWIRCEFGCQMSIGEGIRLRLYAIDMRLIVVVATASHCVLALSITIHPPSSATTSGLAFLSPGPLYMQYISRLHIP